MQWDVKREVICPCTQFSKGLYAIRDRIPRLNARLKGYFVELLRVDGGELGILDSLLVAPPVQPPLQPGGAGSRLFAEQEPCVHPWFNGGFNLQPLVQGGVAIPTPSSTPRLTGCRWCP